MLNAWPESSRRQAVVQRGLALLPFVFALIDPLEDGKAGLLGI